MIAVAPPAPWRCEMRAVLWLQPVPKAVRATLTGAVAGHRWGPVALGGLVAYRDTPVGPYGEVFTALAALDGGRPLGHVPFMAVDSADSVAGGRANWALPKELVRFEGATVRGETWAATIRATVRRPRVPLVGAGRGRQPWPDGVLRDFTSSFAGRAGPAHVRVDAAPGAPLPSWLAAGSHRAVVLDGVLDVLEPSIH